MVKPDFTAMLMFLLLLLQAAPTWPIAVPAVLETAAPSCLSGRPAENSTIHIIHGQLCMALIAALVLL